LNKALYGLRISPLLWQKELSSTLRSAGYTQIPHEPCCFAKDGILIFFYVDDIVIAYPKGQDPKDLLAALQSRYKLTGGNDLQWFLGIEVLRDRKRRLIWLSQSAYIEKISQLVDDTNKGLAAQTPMRSIELLPRDDIALAPEITKYQKKVRSILYAAVITRPDVAFAASRLARFLTNPGLAH
jgi:hypothetical protein